MFFGTTRKTWGVSILTFIIVATATMIFINIQKHADGQALSSQPTKFTASYYGGYYDSKLGWVIDNNDQCNKIRTNKTSEKSLGAVLNSNLKNASGVFTCENSADDPGVGYFNDIPLQNTVSFAELSNNPSSNNPDYSALGNLPARSRVEIAYQGKCVVAEKLDVGTGGYGLNGYPRAIDLWWQTARSLGFEEGLDTVAVRLVSKDTQLTALGSSYNCETGQVSGYQTGSGSSSSVAGSAAAAVNATKNTKQKSKSKKTVKKKKASRAILATSSGQVLAASTTLDQTPISKIDNKMINSLWYASSVAITGTVVAFLYVFHLRRIRHLQLIAQTKKIIHT